MSTTTTIPSTLSVRDAAESLGVSTDFLYGLIAKKKLSAHKVGSRILLKPEAIEDLLSRSRV
jgi:excisionase family DNA binding protein